MRDIGNTERPLGLRALMDSTSATNVTVVESLAEWMLAMNEGVEHVELQAHIDMTGAQVSRPKASHPTQN